MSKKTLFIFALIIFLIYSPALSAFYTNDDFFHLKISESKNLTDFLRFFNFKDSPQGFASYRPLTTQAYYSISRTLFSANPFPLRLISFTAFFAGVVFLYKLSHLLIRNHTWAGLVTFLYLVASFHMGQMYFVGLFQELGLFLFFISSLYYFTKYLASGKGKLLIYSLTFYLLSLMSKETAVTLPGVLFIIYFIYDKKQAKKAVNPNRFFVVLLPYLVVTAAYLYQHYFVYGYAQGDSYFTDFGLKKAANTLAWYGVWSLGIPEMFVDFVGSGLKVNPNLFGYWGKAAYSIIALFSVNLLLLAHFILRAVGLVGIRNVLRAFVLSLLWFVGTVLPMLFFPFHKFAYNVTIPSVGIYLFVSYLTISAKPSKSLLFMFIASYFFLNVVSIFLTQKTHWITNGQKTALRVDKFFKDNSRDFSGKTVIFYDSSSDSNLPWSPTNVLKGVLSDQNYFDVFYPGRSFRISYGVPGSDDTLNVNVLSRDFLGY